MSTDSPANEQDTPKLPSRRLWWAAAIALMATAFLMTLLLASQVPRQLSEERCFDSYFGADVPRVFSGLTSRWTKYGGSTKHPIYCLLVIPCFTFQKLFALNAWNAVGLLLAVNNAALSLITYILAFRITRRIIDASVTTLLMLSTAASIFWMPIPETYAFGATSVMLPLLLIGLPINKGTYVLHVLANLVSMSITITNWTSGLVSSWLSLGTRKAASVAIHAMGVLYAVTILQPLLVPSSGFINAREILFQNDRYGNRQGVTTTINHFFISAESPSAMACSIMEPGGFKTAKWPILDVRPRSGNVVAEIPAPLPSVQRLQQGIWVLLLAAGFIYFVSHRRDSKLLTGIYLVILAHLLITLKYGNESFIYTHHWTPLLVLSLGSLMGSRYRLPFLIAISVLAAANFWTNLHLYFDSMEALSDAIAATSRST